MNAHRFHEWPLVVFTTLAIMGAGLLTAPLVAVIVAQSAAAASPLLLAGAAMLAAGLAVSLAHLGQPQRSPLALARTGRSRLSNEIVLASATVTAGILAAVFPFPSSHHRRLLPSFCAVRVPRLARPRLRPAGTTRLARRGDRDAAHPRPRLRRRGVGGRVGRSACGHRIRRSDRAVGRRGLALEMEECLQVRREPPGSRSRPS